MKIESIKFKAKRLDGKGWAIGDLLHSYENGAIIVPIEGGGAFSVDPSTVCQFTGLKDKNGKEIWEGDYLTPINDSEAMKVIFKEGSFGFDTSYYGMRFHPLAQYDIREGNKLVELILINRKEGEKQKMRTKSTDAFSDLSEEDKDALDTWAHYCKQHEGYERNEQGNI